ncbi:MAG: (deoxy)nucleoside triphosphate pyrophosphohydrolase [Alphaproteobacteria bacterium]|nr:(deoxy)nucleoside triphosphate pyrophosphohydrolase [Alphaproteobacteria bacterium]OJV47142.1 MAG: NTP pyrophosphohydrolase [Alphaproteobacteria bacterium 43-37]
MIKPVLTVVAAAIVSPMGEILLSRRPEGKSMAGMWEFPGGKMEANESPEQALQRELLEEIGIKAKTHTMTPAAFASHAYEDFHLLMPLFLVKEWTNDPVPLEGQLLQWFKLSKIDTASMPPPDGPLVDRIREMIKPIP